MSRRKLPTSYVIKSRKWRIRYLPKDHPDMNEAEGENLLGWCDPTLHQIAVCTEQDDESLRDTLVHELMHAYYSTLPGVDHDDEAAEETWVLAATEAFYEVVRNAKWDFWK